MIVREAYRAREHAVCRRHYNGELPMPADAPQLGEVQDARDHEPCEWCHVREDVPFDDAEEDAHAHAHRRERCL